MNDNNVYVILVSYKCKKYVDDCLKSLLNQTYKKLKIVVVDNNSQDGTVEYIKENYKEVKTVEMDYNAGFGKACNIGAQYALTENAQYILFLNFDTIAESNMVEVLEEYADENTVTTPWIYNEIDKSHSWYTGGTLSRDTLLVDQTIYAGSPCDKQYQVDFISGCCMLIHRSIFDKIGFFDERFFLYYEDVDLCIRLEKAGIKMLYVPSGGLFHVEGGSQQKIGDGETYLAQYYSVRNRLLLVDKHKGYFNVDRMDILQQILEERHYFENFPRYVNSDIVNYEYKAIEDYFKKKFGQCCSYQIENGEGYARNSARVFGWIATCENAYLSLKNYSDSETKVEIILVLEKLPLSKFVEIYCNNQLVYSGELETRRCTFETSLDAIQSKKISIRFPNDQELPEIRYISVAESDKNLNRNVSIAVFGIGVYAQKFLQEYEVAKDGLHQDLNKYYIQYFCETRPKIETFYGKPNIPVEKINFDDIDFLIVANRNFEEIKQCIIENNQNASKNQNKIIWSRDFF